MSVHTIAEFIPLSAVTIVENVRTLTGLDPASIKELSESIKTHGLLQPIIVAKAGDGYAVIAGQRRTLAAKLAGLDAIQAIVTDSSEDGDSLKSIQIVENLHRENLSLAETCGAVREMLAMVGKPAMVAKRLAKSAAWVSKHLAPTGPNFPIKVRALIADGKLNDIETALILNQIAKHPNGGQTFEKLVIDADAGELSRSEARKALDSLKDGANGEADAETDEEGEGAAAEEQESFAKLELAEGQAKLLLAALKFAQEKKPSSQPGEALIGHVESFIAKNWPEQGELPV